MKLYLSIIGVSMFLISLFNIIFNTAPWYIILFLVIICTVLQFALDGLIAIVINKLPDKHFGTDNPIYTVSDAEKKMYLKLHIRRWKDKVWELGGLGGFSKKSLVKPDSAEYIEKFIIECNKGVLTHRLSYLIGFLPMLFIPNICSVTIAFPVALINMFLNILPTLVLRYNTPKLKSVLKRMKSRQ